MQETHLNEICVRRCYIDIPGPPDMKTVQDSLQNGIWQRALISGSRHRIQHRIRPQQMRPLGRSSDMAGLHNSHKDFVRQTTVVPARPG